MKKIMKKVLSLALVVAMAIAPMTVMAAVNDVTEVVTSKEYTAESDWSADYYEYTATEWCRVSVEIESTEDWAMSISGENGYFSFSSAAGDNKSQSFDVAPGSTLYIQVAPGDAEGNWVAGTVVYSITSTEVEAPAVGSVLNPQVVTGQTAQISIPAGSVYYVACQPLAAGDYKVTLEGNSDFAIVEEIPMWQGGGTQEIPSENKKYSTTFMVNPMWGALGTTIAVKNTSATETLVIDIAQEVRVGTSNNPAQLVLGTNQGENAAQEMYYYTWTATEEGTLTIEVNSGSSTNGWKVEGSVMNPETYVSTYCDPISSDLVPAINKLDMEVKTGEQVTIMTSGLPDENMYGAPSVANVKFTASFVAGEVGDQGGNQGGNQGGDQGGDQTEDNYVVSDTKLQVGENNDLRLDGSYKWTLFQFTPSETGIYKLQADDGVIGYWGAGTHFLTEPNEDDCEGFVDGEITAVGQTIVVGVTSVNDGNTVGILVTKIGEAEIETIDWTTYKNTIKPTEYKYDGDVDKLLETYVDTTDKVVDKAVLGKDGYYHLNSENGEILYVNLNDSLMSLANMVTKGKVSAVYYDKDNKVTEAIDFTTALLEYLGVKDIAELEAKNLGTTPVIYPLTADLMTMFQKVGETNDWYGANGFIKGTEAEDAWMFACYYVKGQTTSSTPAPGTTSTDSPKMGDNANVAVWAIVMVVAAGAAFVVAESKRRAR